MASNWIGRIGSLLVRTPGKLLNARNEARQFATYQPGELKLKRIPNSVDTLAPNDQFVVEINKILMTSGIANVSAYSDGVQSVKLPRA